MVVPGYQVQGRLAKVIPWSNIEGVADDIMGGGVFVVKIVLGYALNTVITLIRGLAIVRLKR